jgi:hypothetical protein
MQGHLSFAYWHHPICEQGPDPTMVLTRSIRTQLRCRHSARSLAPAIDMIEGLRYKLWMMGIPLTGPTSVFCDNESVVRNLTAPESTLMKRHNAIAHTIEEPGRRKLLVSFALLGKSGSTHTDTGPFDKVDARAKAEGANWLCALLNPY